MVMAASSFYVFTTYHEDDFDNLYALIRKVHRYDCGLVRRSDLKIRKPFSFSCQQWLLPVFVCQNYDLEAPNVWDLDLYTVLIFALVQYS